MLPSNFNEEIAARVKAIDRRVKRLETLEDAGGGDFVLLEHQEVSGTASEVIFDNVSQAYKHLFIIHSTLGPTDLGDGSLLLQFNGDVGANYFYMIRSWLNTPAETTSFVANANFVVAGQEGGLKPSRFGAGYVLIPDYRNTIKYTSIQAASYWPVIATHGNAMLGGMWEDTAAITDLRFFLSGANDLQAGSIISLYGIR